MSAEFYSKWLIKTKNNLEKVVAYDTSLLKEKSIKDRSLATNLLGGLYARYAMVVQELDACLDQLVQVQKGFTVRKITNAAVTRLNELKEELTKLDISEYHYIDGALIELKLIPQSIEIIYPTLVHPRNDEYEMFWNRLKNDETIYEPGDEAAEDDEDEDAKKVKKKKKKKVAIDPLALLNADSAAVKEEEVIEEEEIEEEEFPIAEHEEMYGEDGEAPRRSTRFSMVREKKKRPCNRPKGASQLEAEMSPAEKAELARRTKYLAAVLLIQAHERARQSRLYVHDVLAARFATVEKASTQSDDAEDYKYYLDDDYYYLEEEVEEEEEEEVPQIEEAVEEQDVEQEKVEEEEKIDIREQAAIKIQTWFRGYLARHNMKFREQKLRRLIGMERASYQSKDELIKLRKSLEKRRASRYEKIKEYYQALLDEKARVLKVVAPGLFEDIGDEIRQWFKDWYYSCKVFKDIPPAAQGGTILVVRGDIESPDEHFNEMLKSGRKGGRAGALAKEKEDAQKAAAEKKKKEDEKKKKAAKKEQAPAKRKGGYEFEPKQTGGMDAIESGMQEYAALWSNINDADNPKDEIYMDVITDQKCYEVQLEVRPKVDELMRLELEILKTATQKDKWLEKKKGKGGKGGKFKPKKGKKGKGKKGKGGGGGGGGGGKKGKKKKDPTGKRKVEDLFQELYNKGIIRKYPEVHIDEYLADFSYQNYEQREMYRDPPATLADARQAVIMNCIVPLGVEKMARAKSVLLAGPRECGLDLLANAVFTETQCVLFDLSPSNLIGCYPGKKGNKELTHLVSKMSKLLQPSVIYIGDCEKAFYKKIPKEEKENDPKRVSKFIGKILKDIKQEDRVLVLGTTYYPFLAQAAKLKKTFQRILLVPRSDYGSVYRYWEDVLLGYHGVQRNFNISALAQMTRHYPLPQIKQAIERVLVPKRIIQLHYKPLEAIELIEALRDGAGPVDDKEWEKYLKFYGGTKLGKARKHLNATFAKIIENEKKKQAKAPKK